MPVPSLQDFSIVKTLVDRIQSERSLPDGASAFYYFVLDSVPGSSRAKSMTPSPTTTTSDFPGGLLVTTGVLMRSTSMPMQVP